MKLLHAIVKGEGTPLLILHGFLGMSDNWKTLGSRFSEHGFQVHLIDQRNHGRSFHEENFSYPLMVEDLLTYIEHHQLKDSIIIGHSMGGKTAMFFATTHPQKVAKLIIVDIAPKYYVSHHQNILQGLGAIDFNTVNSRGKADEVLAEYVPDTVTRQFLLKNLYWTSEKKLDFRFHRASLTKNVEAIGLALPKTSQYHKATLFLKGEHSNYITEEDASDIKMHFPNAEVDEIKNAGHWLHADQPTIFLSKALAFLTSEP